MAKKKLIITPVDHEAQTKGTWIDYHGVKLKIARSNNPVFKKAMLDLQSEGEAMKESAMTDEQKEEKSVEMMAGAMSKGLLLDWSGMPNDTPFSREASEQLMTDDEDCRTFVLTFANDITNFYKDKVNKTLEK
jgi:hypothetical protein